MSDTPATKKPPVLPFARVEPGMELARLADIADPGAISVVFGEGIMRMDVAVVHVGGEVRAFVNSCPHAGTPLETFDGRFFDLADSSIIVCSTHGARFRVEDGFCVSGPCRGLSLKPVPVRVENGVVIAA